MGLFSCLPGSQEMTALKPEVTKLLVLPGSFTTREIEEEMFLHLLCVKTFWPLTGVLGGQGEPRKHHKWWWKQGGPLQFCKKDQVAVKPPRSLLQNSQLLAEKKCYQDHSCSYYLLTGCIYTHDSQQVDMFILLSTTFFRGCLKFYLCLSADFCEK